MDRNDLAQIVTNQIVAALESGVAPWIRPWNAANVAGTTRPRNAATGHEYRGINIFLLWLAAGAAGYSSDLWLTEKQAAERGGKLRDGATPTRIVLCQPRVRVVGQDENGDDVTRRSVLLREFWVYNIDQVEGLDVARLKVKPAAPVAVTQNPEGRRAELDAFLAATGAKIVHGGPSASYSPSTDTIRMPAFDSFRSAADYYATAMHELTHWTGHDSRDARFKSVVMRFGDQAYAAEELIAEMGAAILCAEHGVAGQLQHAEYIGHWLKVLKADKYAVFTAASKAQRALDWLGSSPAAVEGAPVAALGCAA